MVFQSTPPRREVTKIVEFSEIDALISIHTSPKGGDEREILEYAGLIDFNPHLPEGR